MYFKGKSTHNFNLINYYKSLIQSFVIYSVEAYITTANDNITCLTVALQVVNISQFLIDFMILFYLIYKMKRCTCVLRKITLNFFGFFPFEVKTKRLFSRAKGEDI